MYCRGCVFKDALIAALCGVNRRVLSKKYIGAEHAQHDGASINIMRRSYASSSNCCYGVSHAIR